MMVYGEEPGGIRTLFVSKVASTTPQGGGSWRVLQGVRAASAVGPVAVASLQRRPLPECSPPSFVSLWRQLVARKARHRSRLGSRAWLLRRYGHPWAEIVRDPHIDQDLLSLVAEFAPDVVVVAESWLGHYVALLRPLVPAVVLDEFNCESCLFDWHIETWRRTHSRQGLRKRLVQRLMAHRARKLEEWSLRSASHVWVVSGGEERALRRRFEFGAESTVVPNTIDPAFYTKTREERSRRRQAQVGDRMTLLFVGNLGHPPNRDAAAWLIREVYPVLARLLGGCRVQLVGSDPNGTVANWAEQEPGVEVLGRVEDVRTYLASADVALLPLRVGGGARLKVLEAFAACVPVVTTTDGVDGLGVRDGLHVRTGDSTKDLARAVLDLVDPRARERMAEAAFEFVCANYTWDNVSSAVTESLVRLAHGPASCQPG